MEGYIGQIILWPMNFAPRGWALCQGQLLPIAQNQALFAIIGTYYGGDGRTTFALPDLRGRTPICTNAGANPGAKAGAATISLNATHLPAHTHSFNAYTESGDGNASTGALLANTDNKNATTGAIVADPDYRASGTTVQLAAGSITSVGGAPISLLQPSLGINYLICTMGIFPQRG